MFRSQDHHQGAVLSLLKLHYKSHINFAVPLGYGDSMPCCVMLCCEECPATDVHSVLRCVIITQRSIECTSVAGHSTTFVIVASSWLFILILLLLLQNTFAAVQNCQQAAPPVHYTTSCKHSLVLLRMGVIIARNMLS